MSRTNDVNIAMQCAKGGVVGALLMGLHKATIGWVVNTLAAEVERLEVELDALRAIPGGDTEIYVLDDGSHVTGNRAAELLDDEKTRSERAIGEREEQRQRAKVAEAEGAKHHPDDTAVDKFAAAMKAKLERKREQGYHGWDDKDDCSQQHLVGLLVAHMTKGDPVDVGNFAMMLWNRGERTALAETKGGAA